LPITVTIPGTTVPLFVTEHLTVPRDDHGEGLESHLPTRRKYPTGREVSDEQMQRVNLERHKFHGEWNYLIKPNRGPGDFGAFFDGVPRGDGHLAIGLSWRARAAACAERLSADERPATGQVSNRAIERSSSLPLPRLGTPPEP
jgi:Rhodopirellula transposase DDE domain